MNFLALVTDYDGTIAQDGVVNEETMAALKKLAESGRRLILATGRELKNLLEVFPHAEIFDRIVVEDGAVLYCPQTRTARLLTEPAPKKLIEELRKRGVDPVSVGECIIATWHPQECAVLEAIRDLGIERQITFNKGAVMVLPSGINKASGLEAALNELELSAHNVVAVGDAQNDLSFLGMCECSAAVANALDAVRQQADIVMTGDRGAGVAELIDRILQDDLESLIDHLGRGRIVLGTERGNPENAVSLPAMGSSILVAGPSGTGKSTVVTGILERFAERAYQFCLFDPEGDYQAFMQGINLGGPHQPPEASSIFRLLDKMQNPILNLLGITFDRRPQFMAELLPRLQELRAKSGRPHWIVVDKMDHMFPAAWEPANGTVSETFKGLLGITVHPQHVSPAVLRSIDTVLATGETPEQTIRDFCAAAGIAAPEIAETKLEKLEVLVWRVRSGTEPKVVCATPGKPERTLQ